MTTADRSAPRMAGVWDGLEDGRPDFGDRERMEDGGEKAAVLSYLRSGEIILRTTGLTPDFVDTSKGRVVPISYRTDGSWIWTDAITYYFETYGVAPEREFLEHIRMNNYNYVTPSEDVLALAGDVLREDFENSQSG